MVVTAAAAFVAAGVLFTWGGREAAAQIRAALVKNVDQPGRTPYQMLSGVVGGGCFRGSCLNITSSPDSVMYDLPPIPAGKRWVVNMASGGFIDATGRVTQIELRNGRGAVVFDSLKWIFSGPYGTGTVFSSVNFSEQLFTTFEPGETPTVRVSASTPTVGSYFVLSFDGYLIDASN
jgi:hypothetical protein